MKDWRYKHLHRCSDCGATRNCVESNCIGAGSCPPPEGYLETCAACKGRNKKLYAGIMDRIKHLDL